MFGYAPKALLRRTLQQLLRLKRDFDRRRHGFLGVRLDHRKQPALILHGRGEADVGTPHVIATHAKIGHRASPGNEHLTDLQVAKIDLNTIAGTEPIDAPGLGSFPAPANPTTNNIPVVRVTAPPRAIEIEVARRDRPAPWRNIGIYPLRP